MSGCRRLSITQICEERMAPLVANRASLSAEDVPTRVLTDG